MYNKFNYGYGPGCGPHHHHHHGLRGWGGYRRPKHNVPVNIIENETNYEVHVYALGFAKEDIKVAVATDTLYITGTRIIDENYQPNFIRQEYPIKSFERVLDLNGAVDATSIAAKHENGVLIITLPKSPSAQKTDQEIKVN
ncbi:MAG TPA: Hsp20/alpha crystallin family protein [Bacteroidia bacterium]|nr:Hsp20/alpha crystallin family protein [Bacteroidia bacterium]